MTTATAYEPVIGLEVHAQLKTNTKMFCGCSTVFGQPPNTQVCPVCLGLPGSLPVPNAQAFEFALKTALALNCEIVGFTKFDRKNYYYPDLPKNYQISQYDLPFSKKGYLDIEVDGKVKRIGITRIHMEEDAGKLVHSDDNSGSGVDLNRAGTPLLEIVSEPDIRTAAEARAYMEKLAHILEFTGVCDCNMQEGSLRCDANVSIRPAGQEKFNTRREIKNMNSFRFVEAAIITEIAEQKAIYGSGGTINQETRLFNGQTGEIRTMRTKEDAQDYRYFPEPDLPPITITPEMIAALKGNREELPEERKKRYVEQYKLSDYDASVLTNDKGMGDYFEAALKLGVSPKAAANWITADLQGILKERNLTIDTCGIAPPEVVELIDLVEKHKKVNRTAAKEIIFPKMLDTKNSALRIATDENLIIVADTGATEKIIDEVLAKSQKFVADYVAGKDAVVNAIFGACMKEFKGKGDPAVIRPMLEKKLKALREKK
jgi:aspartyl-tRNA(Asn)/glutamyl-tRNA(Gln) amidotransferase subunit B